jgi:hypothetical protein
MSREDYNAYDKSLMRKYSGWPNVARAVEGRNKPNTLADSEQRFGSFSDLPSADEAPRRRGRPPKSEAESGDE